MRIVRHASNAMYCYNILLPSSLVLCHILVLQHMVRKNVFHRLCKIFSNSANSKTKYLATMTFTAQEHHDEEFLWEIQIKAQKWLHTPSWNVKPCNPSRKCKPTSSILTDLVNWGMPGLRICFPTIAKKTFKIEGLTSRGKLLCRLRLAPRSFVIFTATSSSVRQGWCCTSTISCL